MSDVTELSEREMAELCALADGTLPAERRAAVEARVAASAELQTIVDRQRRSLAATRALASDPVPAPLAAAVAARRRSGARPLRRIPHARRWALAAALVVAGVAAAIVLNGGPAAPTVAEAAQLASRPATAPAPADRPGSTTQLALAVQGVAFPDLGAAYGWQAVGARHDTIDGRRATVVLYANGARRLGYVIVAGPGLPRPSGPAPVTVAGTEYQVLSLNGRLAVTWRRGGHTCVLTGAASRSELIRLASWRG